MTGQEKTHRLIFALQALGRQPRLERGQRQRLVASRGRRTFRSARAPHSRGRVAPPPVRSRPQRRARAVGLERIERPGGGKALEHPLVDGARIDAAGEIGKVGKGPFAARGKDTFDGLAADAPERRERVVDGVALDLEFDAASD